MLPAVRALRDIEFGSVTILVGDNGSGKSTIVEALAVAAGFNAEGGSRNLRFETYATHSDLAEQLVLRWERRPRWGWFLRAETFYGMASHVHADDDLSDSLGDWGDDQLGQCGRNRESGDREPEDADSATAKVGWALPTEIEIARIIHEAAFSTQGAYTTRSASEGKPSRRPRLRFGLV